MQSIWTTLSNWYSRSGEVVLEGEGIYYPNEGMHAQIC
jgi:hypothetical protein